MAQPEEVPFVYLQCDLPPSAFHNSSICSTPTNDVPGPVGCCLVPPATSPAGLTYFPNSTTCFLTSYWENVEQYPSIVGNVGGGVILFIVLRLSRMMRSTAAERQAQAHAEATRRAEQEGHEPPPPLPKAPLGGVYALLLGSTALRGGASDPNYRVKLVLAVGGFIAQMGSSIYFSLRMYNSIQANLHPTERNVVGAVDAVITPLEIIFGSLEHYALVMASRSIMGGDAAAAGRLFYRIILLSAACGVAAALVGTLISLPPGWIDQIATPGQAADARLYPGCSQIPSAATIGPPSYSYYLMRMWKLPLRFVNGALNGFMIGGGMMIIQVCVLHAASSPFA